MDGLKTAKAEKGEKCDYWALREEADKILALSLDKPRERHEPQRFAAEPQRPSKTPNKQATRTSARTPRKKISREQEPSSPPRRKSPNSESSEESEGDGNSEVFDTIRYLRKLQSQLHASAVPSDLVCRGDERDAVVNFLRECWEKKQGNSLYVSGAPGTGKSLSVRFAVNTIRGMAWGSSLAITTVNAMSLKSPHEFYPHVLRELTGNAPAHISAADAAALIEEHLVKAEKMCLLIVDELDALLNHQQTLLYRLFGWANGAASKFVLIGIANALDLTERFLPRLRERQCEPRVLTFHPYDREQLKTIVTQRLLVAQNETKNDDGAIGLFHGKVIQLLAMKVAALGGDVRKCMDLCRQCLDELERLMLKEPSTKPVVTFQIMQSVCKTVTGNPLCEIIERLPHHQQILLSIAAITHRDAKEELTQRLLRSKYTTVTVAKLQPGGASKNEFIECLTSLVENGLVKTNLLVFRGGLKKGVSDKIVMNVTWNDVSSTLLSDPNTSAAVKSILRADLNSDEFSTLN